MKFVIAAVVVLALALGAQSSIIPGLEAGVAGPLLAQGPTVIGWGASVPAAINIAGIPTAVATAAIPAVGATYVAKTRGAVHTAPLPGHTQSAASVNVAPAPGTW